MLDDLATELLSRGPAPRYLIDPPLTPESAQGPIPEGYIAQVKKLLLETLDDEQLLAEWFAQFMTAPKYPMLVDETGEQRTATLRNADGSISHYENSLKQ